MGMNHARGIGTHRMNGAMNHKAGPIDAVIIVWSVNNIAINIDFDQRGRRDLVI